jgi:hypothetical protein
MTQVLGQMLLPLMLLLLSAPCHGIRIRVATLGKEHGCQTNESTPKTSLWNSVKGKATCLRYASLHCALFDDSPFNWAFVLNYELYWRRSVDHDGLTVYSVYCLRTLASCARIPVEAWVSWVLLFSEGSGLSMCRTAVHGVPPNVQRVSYILKHSEANSELAHAKARIIRHGCRRMTEE